MIAGGTGLIGRALSESLIRDGFDVDILTRRMTAPRQVPSAGVRTMAWNPANPDGLPALARALAGCHAVVNLTGVPVGPLPWTAGRRRSIFASRVEPTNYLVEAMTSLAREDRPAVFVGASGTDGYTGIDDAPATEETDITATTGFLADVGRAWEAAALGAEALGVRVVLVRTAFVLARASALLPLLALPVRLGFGGRFGTGRQWFSWVHIDDLIGAYRLAILDPGIAGPLLGAAPEPCQQRDLVETLARVLRRPNWLPVPGWLLRLVLRERSDTAARIPSGCSEQAPCGRLHVPICRSRECIAGGSGAPGDHPSLGDELALGHHLGLVAVDFLAECPEDLELDAVLGPPSRPLHRDEIVQRCDTDPRAEQIAQLGGSHQRLKVEARIRVGQEIETSERRVEREQRSRTQRARVQRWHRRTVRREPMADRLDVAEDRLEPGEVIAVP